MNKVIIGLAGLGTVGKGLVELLQANTQEIERRTGKQIILKWVAVRDTTKARELPEHTQLCTDPMIMIQDPEVQLVVELMGGIETPKIFISAALEAGKSVVTANKALLAEQGEELFALAEKNNIALAYEASVAGAIPIVQTLKDSLGGNHISSILGILNGTSNYILSEMSSNGLDFDIALKQAQELGFAEADPTLDIDGKDAAHKLALIIRLAWGVHYPFEMLPMKGIRGISPLDIKFAKEFGYEIKLLGKASDNDGTIEAGVFPFLVSHSSLLAVVDGPFNAIRINGNAVGSLFLHGLGAGGRPTASAVLGDILAIIRDTYDNTGYVNILPKAKILDSGLVKSAWYVRLMVREDAGVLRDIAGALATKNVSIAQVIQKKEQENGVPIVFTTHITTASAVQSALELIKSSGMLNEEPVCYGVYEPTESE